MKLPQDFNYKTHTEQRDILLGVLFDLEAENGQLKNEIALRTGHQILGEITTRFNLTKQEASALLLLHGAGGRALGKAYIVDHIAHRDDSDLVELKLVEVVVCKIRRKLGRDSIITVWGLGYRLSDKYMELLNEIAEYCDFSANASAKIAAGSNVVSLGANQ